MLFKTLNLARMSQTGLNEFRLNTKSLLHEHVTQRSGANPCEAQGRGFGETVENFCIAIVIRVYIKVRVEISNEGTINWWVIFALSLVFTNFAEISKSKEMSQ